jgi:hypothetical protein
MNISTYLGRQIIRREKVAESGTFSSFYSAERKLKNMGYTLGSMCGSEPIGFANSKNYDYISKWRNIGMDERNKLDGVMISDDWRDGIVQIIWFNEPLE